MRALAFSLLVLCSACGGYRPARFADRPPVKYVHDDQPIAVPVSKEFISELHQADVYVRRELVKALDPRRKPDALDVNSLDEVPRSSWFRPPTDPREPLYGYLRDGPPVPPLTTSDDEPVSGIDGSYVVTDARGLYYELVRDFPDRAGMRTSVLAIASRVLHMVGYRTPEVHIIHATDGERVAALRWPIGIDLGPTPIVDRRNDDPNDHLPHLERRSLRALTVFTSWLAVKRLPPRVLRDAYVGQRGRGHVQHFVVGLDGALGVDDLLDAIKFANDPDRENANFFLKAFSIGLSPKPYSFIPPTRWPSVGLLTEHLLPEHESPTPPFEPKDFMRGSDGYWAAKRIAALPDDDIRRALAAGVLDDAVRGFLLHMLRIRRHAILSKHFESVTPCELVRITPPDRAGGVHLVIEDLALVHATASATTTRYRIEYYDAAGDELADAVERPARGPRSSLPVPPALHHSPYLVARIIAMRNGEELPRGFEIHLKPERSGYRLLGLRH